MNETIIDIRQSKKWANYIKKFGWFKYRFDNFYLYKKNILIFSIAKVQRPKQLDIKDLGEIENFCKANKVLFIKLEPSNLLQKNILEEGGYIKSYKPLAPPSTIRIDLSVEVSTLRSRLSKSAKYSTNRAKREKTNIKIIHDPGLKDLRDFYKLEKSTGKHKGFKVRDFNDLKLMVKTFKDDAVLVLAYDKDNNLCGGKFFLISGKAVWYMHGGTNSLGRKNKSGYLLVWESLLHFKSLKIEVLDFEGICDSRFPHTLGWQGTTTFKKKFGGKIIKHPYPYVKYFGVVGKILNHFM